MATLRIGLVSDTHGLKEARLEKLFDGVSSVLHAGDVGPGVLGWMNERWPTRAVKGNNDDGPWGNDLPGARTEAFGVVRVAVIHICKPPPESSPQAEFLVAAEAPDIVLFGHSHQPFLEVRDGRIYVNPGSAGPQRFKLPRAAGVMMIDGRSVEIEVRDLISPRMKRIAGLKHRFS